MIEALFGVLLQGLKLWNTKESTKYLDKVISLRSEWLEEYSKPRAERDNSKLDDIESALYIIARTFSEINIKK
jgi:hypothetical protein